MWVRSIFTPHRGTKLDAAYCYICRRTTPSHERDTLRDICADPLPVEKYMEVVRCGMSTKVCSITKVCTAATAAAMCFQSLLLL